MDEDLGGRRPIFTDSQMRSALRLIESGESATHVARDLGMSRATLYRRIRELPPSIVRGSFGTRRGRPEVAHR
nr:helix-turn-helix domain-containing protein [Kocuria turfanensis]